MCLSEIWKRFICASQSKDGWSSQKLESYIIDINTPLQTDKYNHDLKEACEGEKLANDVIPSYSEEPAKDALPLDSRICGFCLFSEKYNLDSSELLEDDEEDILGRSYKDFSWLEACWI